MKVDWIETWEDIITRIKEYTAEAICYSEHVFTEGMINGYAKDISAYKQLILYHIDDKEKSK